MTNLEIYAGLVPILLGIIGIALAKFELARVEGRSFPIWLTPQTFVYPAVGALTLVAIGGYLVAHQSNLISTLTSTPMIATVEITAKEAIGSSVVDSQNKKIGEVSDVLIHKNAVVINEGAPNGKASIEVPMESLQWERAQGDSDDESFTAKIKRALNPPPTVGATPKG
jgi:hypothetical protein